MARRTRLAVPSDTCLFSPLQLQPASVLRFGMTALAGCIGTQLVPWRQLKHDHLMTVVIVGVRIDYLRDFGFFSADEIEVDAGLLVRRGGRFLELDCRLGPADDPCAALRVLYRPVRLSGTEALDATPASFEGPLLALFADDEVEQAPITRPVVDRVAALAEGTGPVDEGELPFTVSRADCEIADQWQNVRLPDWLAMAREQLVFAAADPRLKTGLSEPITHLYAEFRRPMYLGDAGVVHTRAYADDHGGLSFVHEVRSVVPGGPTQVCAVAVEEFSTGGVA